MDREKVIKSVDICLGNGHCADCHYSLGRAGITTMDCRKYLLTDVLVLLKEQEAVVRCKDCKHYKGGRCWNVMRRYKLKDDLFCADGERRET